MVEEKTYDEMNNPERLQYLYKKHDKLSKELEDFQKRYDEFEEKYEHLTEKRKKNFHSMSLEESQKSLDESRRILENKKDISRLILNTKREIGNVGHRISYEEKVKREDNEIDNFNSWIDGLKKDGFKGLVNVTDFNSYLHSTKFLAIICDERDDLRKVNTNQYKIIYEDIGEVKTDFEIKKPNELFYKEDERFKNKKQLIEFLDKSQKVYLNSDMCFIPYTYKQDNYFYLLVVNNILGNIEDYQLKSLNFLNKQNNIYYIIDTNRDDRFKDVNAFKNYVLKTCQKYVNYNMDLLYSAYSKVDNFKKDKAIVRQYS